ncbi:hypothetical protein ACWHAQ_29450, partial [Streptomyces koyangensis]
MRGRAVVAGAVATLAVVAGVTYWAVSGDDEPFTVSGYEAMCQKPREYAEAAPHAGSGPRPVYIDGFWPLPDTDAKELNAAERRTWSPKEPGKVQLIACVDHLGVLITSVVNAGQVLIMTKTSGVVEVSKLHR